MFDRFFELFIILELFKKVAEKSFSLKGRIYPRPINDKVISVEIVYTIYK